MAPRKRGTDLEVQDIMAATKANLANKPGGRSAVYAWMWDHFDTLLPEITAPTAGGADWWAAFAKALADRGLLDGGRGKDEAPKPPTATTARQTWWKVTRDRERWARGEQPKRGRPRKAPAGAPKAAAPSPPAVERPTPQAHPEGDKPAGGGFELARPKGWKPGGSA